MPSANATKLYHSIHARGERVEDVIQDTEAEEEEGDNGDVQMNEQAAPFDMDIKDEDLEDGEVDDHEEVLLPDDVHAPQVHPPGHLLPAVF